MVLGALFLRLSDYWLLITTRRRGACPGAPTQIRYQIREGRWAADVAGENDKGQTWRSRFRPEF